LTRIDDLRYIDVCRYEELEMLRLFRKTKNRVVWFCERCGSVCDSGCRSEAIREHARQRALAYGWRQA
jgi:hypothetical protein